MEKHPMSSCCVLQVLRDVVNNHDSHYCEGCGRPMDYNGLSVTKTTNDDGGEQYGD